MYAPICIFTWRRIDHLKKTIEALQRNYLATDSELFVCSNAAISQDEIKIVENIREYVSSIDGFKKVTLIPNEVNKGYSENLFKNVTHILDKYGKIIVLEEDMVTNPNFLDYMNQALDFYANYEKVQQIGGYCIPIDIEYKFDTYMIPRCCSWSWATWKEKWESLDFNPDIKELKAINKRKFCRAGYDMKLMLKDLINGDLDTWDITSDCTMYKNEMVTVYPCKSFMVNIGVDGSGDHCGITDIFNPILEDTQKREFNFDSESSINKTILRKYYNFYNISFLRKLYYSSKKTRIGKTLSLFLSRGAR